MRSKGRSVQGKSKRFVQYELDARRVGKNVGPGAYNQTHHCIVAALRPPRSSYYFFKHTDSLNNSHYFRDYSATIPNFLRSRLLSNS
jgi:hypothetical protein